MQYGADLRRLLRFSHSNWVTDRRESIYASSAAGRSNGDQGEMSGQENPPVVSRYRLLRVDVPMR